MELVRGDERVVDLAEAMEKGQARALRQRRDHEARSNGREKPSRAPAAVSSTQAVSAQHRLRPSIRPRSALTDELTFGFPSAVAS
jgi:hypothetical protein